MRNITIGQLYEYGLGARHDHAEAFSWFRKAAALGDPGAEFYIGMAYAKGDAVPYDMTKARAWLAKAAAGGIKEAKDWLASH